MVGVDWMDTPSAIMTTTAPAVNFFFNEKVPGLVQLCIHAAQDETGLHGNFKLLHTWCSFQTIDAS